MTLTRTHKRTIQHHETSRLIVFGTIFLDGSFGQGLCRQMWLGAEEFFFGSLCLEEGKAEKPKPELVGAINKGKVALV